LAVGDEIVLASTDSIQAGRSGEHFRDQGNTITLDNKRSSCTSADTFDVDERGEVGMITRNIKLQHRRRGTSF